MMDFTTAHHAARAHFPDEAAFQNLNTPEDLARGAPIMKVYGIIGWKNSGKTTLTARFGHRIHRARLARFLR